MQVFKVTLYHMYGVLCECGMEKWAPLSAPVECQHASLGNSFLPGSPHASVAHTHHYCGLATWQLTAHSTVVFVQVVLHPPVISSAHPTCCTEGLLHSLFIYLFATVALPSDPRTF